MIRLWLQAEDIGDALVAYDGDVEATARFRIKEAVEAGSFHIGTNR